MKSEQKKRWAHHGWFGVLVPFRLLVALIFMLNGLDFSLFQRTTPFTPFTWTHVQRFRSVITSEVRRGLNWTRVCRIRSFIEIHFANVNGCVQ